MNAKVMILVSDQAGETLCNYAESVLTEIALSFSHDITVLRERIGSRSMEAWGSVLTGETVDACAACDGILCTDADAEGMEDLCAMLRIPLLCRISAAGDRLDGVTIARAVDMDLEVLNRAVQGAFDLAERQRRPLTNAAPAGRNAALAWESAVKVQGGNHPHVPCRTMKPETALSFLIEHPEDLGVLLLPAGSGRMFCAAERSLSRVPAMTYERCISRDHSVYAPVRPTVTGSADKLSPLGMMICLEELLRDRLKLENEADCLRAATENVLHADWRTADMPGKTPAISSEAMVRLILEQIELAGNFMRG